ncbi:MAG: glycosyl hydrolase, partial [Candidatus Micrarchaeales archaeon]
SIIGNEQISDGVKYFRTRASYNSWDINAMQSNSTMYNAQYLLILSGPVILPSPVMSQNVLSNGCLANCNWTLNDWKAGVANTVKNYPFVTTWEIWNEPEGVRFQSGYENGNAIHYFNMIKSASKIIKAANPNAIVVCFGGAAINSANQLAWYTSVWNMGASKYCDAISLHAYLNGNENLSTIISKGRGIKENISVEWNADINKYESLTHKPIWITETGMPASIQNKFGATYTLSDSIQNQYLDQAFTSFISNKNVTRIYWFDAYGLSDMPFGKDFGLYNYTTLNPRASLNTFMSFYNNSNSKAIDSSSTPAPLSFSSNQNQNSIIVAGNVLQQQILGITPSSNATANNDLYTAGIRYFRLDATQSPYAANGVLLMQLTYNAQYLMILGDATMNAIETNQSGTRVGCTSGCNWTLSDWNSAVANAVKEYPNIKAWEIWDEPLSPNLQSGYQNGNPGHYFKMIKSAYQIIKSANPNAIVVCFGGITGTATSNTEDMIWAKQVWDLGASKYCDAISLHAYPSGSTLLNATKKINGVTETVAQQWNSSINYYESLTKKPIWITETGMPANVMNESAGNSAVYSDSTQNAFMTQVLNLFSSNPAIARVYWFNTYGIIDYPLDRDLGLINYASFAERPAFFTFKNYYKQSAAMAQTKPIKRLEPTLTIASNSITYGASDLITASVTHPKYVVEILEGAKVLVKGNGTVTINANSLPAGRHVLIATDLTNQLSKKAVLVIAKAVPVLDLGVPANTVYDGTYSNIVSSISTVGSQLSANTYVDRLDMASTRNSDNVSLAAAGIYTINLRTSGNQNYTPANLVESFRIAKATPRFSITSMPHGKTYNGKESNISAQIFSVGNQLTANIVVNGAPYPGFNTSNTVGVAAAGYYTVYMETVGNRNYTQLIMKAGNFWIVKAKPKLTLVVPNSFKFTGTGAKIKFGITSLDNQLTAYLKLNTAPVANTTTTAKFMTSSAIGVYTVRVITFGNQNYTSANTTLLTFDIT